MSRIFVTFNFIWLISDIQVKCLSLTIPKKINFWTDSILRLFNNTLGYTGSEVLF